MKLCNLIYQQDMAFTSSEKTTNVVDFWISMEQMDEGSHL